jgi:hypothetical protein
MKLTKRIKTTILVYANLAAAMVGIGAFTYTRSLGSRKI